MDRATLLLTGFEAFGGETVNPSWLVAQALDGEIVAGLRVRALCLPCVFGDALAQLQAVLRDERPALVLALGQAAGRAQLSIERVAINVDDACIADNAGRSPVDEPVIADAPAAYFATLPIKAMLQALRDAGLPAAVSQTAGTFVCNHVFFGLMHALRRRRHVRAGFIHLPLLPGQVATGDRSGLPSLPLAQMVQGVRLALRTAASTVADLRLAAGAES